MKSRILFMSLTLGWLTSVGCGASSPASPTASALSGVWLGEQTLTSFTGGECLAPIFADLVGYPSQFHATLTQSGKSITAMLDIDHTGGVCTYTGEIEGNALTLTATSCTGVKVVAVPCASGALRGLLPASETLHGTVIGNTIVGAAIENDSVVESGTTNGVGTWAANSSFTLTRQ